MMREITGGVCAARGFRAGAIRCGVKASSPKDDTAVILSAVPCAAAEASARLPESMMQPSTSPIIGLPPKRLHAL